MVATRHMYQPWRCFENWPLQRPEKPKKAKPKPESHGVKKRRLRYGLYRKQDGKCHFCGVQMVHYAGRGKWPDNAVVLYSLRSRLNEERGKHPGVLAKVACCRRCAQEQSDDEQLNHPIEELWRRSGSYPSQVYEIAEKSTHP